MGATLSNEQKAFYENVYQVSKAEIEETTNQIEKELAKVKEKITKLNAEKQAVRQVYEGACARLGIESEFEKADEGDVFEEEEVEE